MAKRGSEKFSVSGIEWMTGRTGCSVNDMLPFIKTVKEATSYGI